MKFRQSAIKSNLQLRANIIQSVRKFFIEHDYLETETPCRIPAPAPEAYIDPVASEEWLLQTSPELCMKQLLAAGYDRIFQICKAFRKQERGERHLPEFTILEWYCANICYYDMMEQCEELINYVAINNGFGNTLIYQGETIDLSVPWNRISVHEAFERYSPLPIETALLNDKFDEMIACKIEPNLGRGKPTFLYDYPASCGALARLKKDNPLIAERFELYICGMELCNAFSELTDPVYQRMRFEKERLFRYISGKKNPPMPEKFLNALQDMPQAAGNALGIDRLVMLFADTPLIDNIVAFTPDDL